MAEEFFVMGNGAFVDAARPDRVSAPIDRFGSWVFACQVSEEKAMAVTEEICQQRGAWWHSFGSSNVSWAETPWQPRIARKQGVFSWMCDVIGASTERSVCSVLGDICEFEGKDPVELFNSFAKTASYRPRSPGHPLTG